MADNCYKPSIYNLFTDNFDGDLLILNTFSGKLAKVYKDKRDAMLKYLAQEKLEEEETPQFAHLKENGFIVEYSVDEKEHVDYDFYKMVYSNEMLELTILPTDACNFNCSYCYQHEPYHVMSKETEETIIKFIDRNIKNYKKLYVSWFGGEPLLAKETVIRLMGSIKEICKRDGVVLMSRMTTNGYEMDLDTFEKLVANKVMYYQITLDGPAETHNVQRPLKNGNPSFDRIINNLYAIRDKATSKRFQIGIRMNISQSVLPHMDSFINYIYGEFGNDPRFSMMWEWVRDWGGTKVQAVQNELLGGPTAFLNWIDEATRRKLVSTDYFSYKRGAMLCEACKNNGYVINYDATIHKCSLALYDKREEFRDVNNIGYIDPNGKLHVDESKSARWVIRRKQLEECKTCVCYPSCMGVGCAFSFKVKQEKRCDKNEVIGLLKCQVRSKDMQGMTLII